MCRIAEALIALQQQGKVEYIGWSQCFICDAPCIVTNLNFQASEMERSLEEWKCEVSKRRSEFYELNYFTTQQLLCLTEELGKFQSMDRSGYLSPKAMALLQSISPNVSEGFVKESVSVIALLQEGELHNIQNSRTLSLSTSLEPCTLSCQIKESGLTQHRGNVVSETVSFKALFKPKLNPNDLTQNQRKILFNLEENYGYTKDLILLAFENCKVDNVYDIIDWCDEHENETPAEKKTLPASSDDSNDSYASTDSDGNRSNGRLIYEVYFQCLI